MVHILAQRERSFAICRFKRQLLVSDTFFTAFNNFKTPVFKPLFESSGANKQGFPANDDKSIVCHILSLDHGKERNLSVELPYSVFRRLFYYEVYSHVAAQFSAADSSQCTTA